MTRLLFAAFILMSIVGREGVCLKKSTYQDSLKSLDLYTLPQKGSPPLTRKDLFKTIADRGLPIKIAHQEYEMAEEVYNISYYQWNYPRVDLVSKYTLTETRNLGTESRLYNFGLNLTNTTPWGLSYTINVPAINGTASQDPTFGRSELDTSQLGATVGLKLLGGSYFVLGDTARRSTDISFQTARLQLRATTLTTIQQGEQAFFDLLQKQLNVQVLEQAYESAKALRADVEEMIRVGESERLALIKVDLQIAQAEVNLLQAQIDHATSKEALREILAKNEEGAAEIVADPNELKEVPEISELSLTKSIERAKKGKPSWLLSQLDKEAADIAVTQTFSSTLPQLDLTAGYGYQATGNTISGSFRDLSRLENPNFTIGLVFNYTIFDSIEKANYRQAEIRLTKAEYAVNQSRNQLVKEVSSAVQTTNIAYKKLKLASLTRTLSEKRLQAEFEKFRLGESAIRNVIDFQNEVNTARIGEVGARVALRQSLSTLRTVMGDLPEGITIQYPQ